MATVTAGSRRAVRVADRGRLARDLSGAVEGEVRFDPGSQALYANDASIYRQVPVGAGLGGDVGATLHALLPLLSRNQPVIPGAGTGRHA
ncbi:MAG: hypothetical protein J2P30_17810 [Actinobacteria bacterium]|nr:hypothetical protein [Actinomycetota bacterium]